MNRGVHMVLAHVEKPQAGGSAWHREQKQLDGSFTSPLPRTPKATHTRAGVSGSTSIILGSTLVFREVSQLFSPSTVTASTAV